MEDLTINAKRDAHAAVRGYVYQVDLTILRWINLRRSDLLHVEFGEDIAAFHGALEKDGQAQSVTLEQVKKKHGTISLSTVEATTAIANFLELHLKNRDKSLVFVYTTTAIESGCDATGLGNKALSVWNSFKTLEEEEQKTFIGDIGCLIEQAVKPAKLSQDAWERTRNYFNRSHEDDIAKFVKSVTWQLGSATESELSEEICDLLVTNGLAHSKTSAQTLHGKLTVNVLRRIGDPNRAPVARAILDAISTEPYDPTPGEARLISELANLHKDVENIARTVATMSGQLGEVCQKLSHVRIEIPVEEEEDPSKPATGIRKSVREEVMKLLDQSSPDEALQKLDEWMKLSEENASDLAYLHNLRATVLRWKGDLIEAHLAFGEAFKLKNNLRYKTSQSLCLIEMGREAEAEVLVDQVLQEKVFDYAVLVKSQALKRQYKDEEALSVLLDESVQWSETNKLDYEVNLAEALINDGKIDQGLDRFEQILVNHKSPSIIIDFAGFLNFISQQRNDPTLAERTIQILELLPDYIVPHRTFKIEDAQSASAMRHVLYSSALHLTGDSDSAVRYAEQHLNEDVSNEIAAHLLPLYAKTNRLEKHRNLLQKFSLAEAMKDVRIAYPYTLEEIRKGITWDEFELLLKRFPDRRLSEVYDLQLKAAWHHFNGKEEDAVEIQLQMASTKSFDLHDRMQSLGNALYSLLRSGKTVDVTRIARNFPDLMFNQALLAFVVSLRRSKHAERLGEEYEKDIEIVKSALVSKPLTIGFPFDLVIYQSFVIAADGILNSHTLSNFLCDLIKDHKFSRPSLNTTITGTLLGQQRFWKDIEFR